MPVGKYGKYFGERLIPRAVSGWHNVKEVGSVEQFQHQAKVLVLGAFHNIQLVRYLLDVAVATLQNPFHCNFFSRAAVYAVLDDSKRPRSGSGFYLGMWCT